MSESPLAVMQRKQIEVTIGELLLTSDFYMRLEIIERLRHMISHADSSLDMQALSEVAQDELHELNLI